jgi:hypothetical protein
MSPRRFVATLALVVALALSACVRESDENANEGVNAPGDAVAIEVRITDEEISLPDEVPAGRLVFEVTNNGETDHGFAIEGVAEQLDDLAIDELDVLRVELEPGTYTVFSPVDGDREAGLERTLTVTEATEDDNSAPADGGVGPSEEQDPIDDDGL